MSNLAIFHIQVALNIKFNSKKGLTDTKNCLNCNSQGVWTKLWGEIVFSDSLENFLPLYIFLRIHENSETVIVLEEKL